MLKLADPERGIFRNLDGFRVEFIKASMRADIVLNRPPFNAISLLQRDQFIKVFEVLDADPSVRVIVVRGEGEHFSSGGELGGASDIQPRRALNVAGSINAPSRCSKPVIAANRGYCFGLGFELALACDFRIATETTLYAMPSQKAGQVPGASVSARLLKTVGLGRTKDMIMRSRYIQGPQAYEWGIATEFVVDSDLENATDALVSELLAFPSLPQRSVKTLLNEMDSMAPSITLDVDEQYEARLRCPDEITDGSRSPHAMNEPLLQR
jgi:2-oxoglutaroyl-CoA hydrolase